MARKVSVLVACSVVGVVASALPTLADVQNTVGVCNGNVPVTIKMRIQNRTGQAANDVHFHAYQNDRRSVVVQGATVNVVGQNGPGTTVGLTLTGANGRRNPPPGNHGVDINVAGLNPSVPDHGFLEMDVTLCMNERNCVKFDNVQWTNNGAVIQPRRGRGRGWRIQRARAGGSLLEGGGVAGATYSHAVCIESDDDYPIDLKEVKLLPSATDFADIENDIDWSLVSPISGGVPQVLPYTIPPHGRWCYDLTATGAGGVGDHVYLRYVSEDPEGDPEDDGDDDVTFGDHPVDALCTDDACSEFPPPTYGTCCDTLTETCVSTYAYECTGTSEQWSDVMGACCFDDGCARTTNFECSLGGGVYHGDDSLCKDAAPGGECIPAASTWGLAAFVVLLLIAATVTLRRRAVAA